MALVEEESERFQAVAPVREEGALVEEEEDQAKG
jgi:hypothetical protein